MSEFKLVTVYRSMGMLGAQVIKSKLEIAGIPVLLKYEAAGQIFGLTVDGLGLVQVQVPEECAADAEALIAEAPDESPDDEAWDEDLEGDTPIEDETPV
jgi:hypothetical protein